MDTDPDSLSQDPENFQNLTGTSLSKVTFVLKFSWTSDTFFQRYEPNSDCPISQCWRILQKIPGSGSASGWLPKFNQFFLVHGYISDERQTLDKRADQQTNDRHYITSLAGEGRGNNKNNNNKNSPLQSLYDLLSIFMPASLWLLAYNNNDDDDDDDYDSSSSSSSNNNNNNNNQHNNNKNIPITSEVVLGKRIS